MKAFIKRNIVNIQLYSVILLGISILTTGFENKLICISGGVFVILINEIANHIMPKRLFNEIGAMISGIATFFISFFLYRHIDSIRTNGSFIIVSMLMIYCIYYLLQSKIQQKLCNKAIDNIDRVLEELEANKKDIDKEKTVEKLEKTLEIDKKLSVINLVDYSLTLIIFIVGMII